MAEHGSQDWVVSKLSKYKHEFRSIPEAALQAYNDQIGAEVRFAFSARTKADALNALAIAEAKRRFDNEKRTFFMERNGTVYQLTPDCVIWYKKLNEAGLPCNYPTETALELMQGRFPWLPERVLLVIGYEVDELFKTITSVQIQRYTSTGRLKFYIEVERPTPTAKVFEMQAAASSNGRRDRVRLRKGPEQKVLDTGSE